MKKWKKFTVILLAMITSLTMAVPVSAAMFPIDIGTTDDGDYIIGRNLTVVSGFEVDRNMYISPGGSYTFYGELTVHGNLYVLGDFYNHGTINVDGNIFCLNYYQGNCLLERATQDDGNGNTQCFDNGNFYNYGDISSPPYVDANYAFIEIPTVWYCTHSSISKATCTKPKKCKDCGKVLNGALGHNWRSATCTSAKKCSRCGKTAGKALGHKWSKWKKANKATVFKKATQARICSRCKRKQSRSVGSKLKPILKFNRRNVNMNVYGSTNVRVTLANGDRIKSAKPQNRSMLTVGITNKQINIYGNGKAGKTKILVTLASGKKGYITVTIKKPAYTIADPGDLFE